jgi:DNA-binding NarL/FixJ family response regulator
MIRNLIEEQADWRVTAEASDGLEAVEKAKMDCPDLAILEISMSKMNGIEAARQIVTSCPRTIILADSFHDFRRFGDELSKSGIHGFVLKSRIATDLVPAIEAVLNGGTWFDEAREHA